VPRDLAVIEAQVELRDHHRPLALRQSREEASDLHPIESRFDLIVAAGAGDPFEWQKREASEPPRTPHRDDEEPPGEVGVMCGWLAESRDERIVKRVECAIAIA